MASRTGLVQTSWVIHSITSTMSSRRVHRARKQPVKGGTKLPVNRRNKSMSRHLAWFFSVVVMLAVSAPLQALNYEVGGCKTGSGYVNFTTISAAVVGVPAGSKILVCPGVYPEQVTITQPLTLQGIASNNSNRAVITINSNGSSAANVTSISGQGLYAQVLVQNVSPAGPVNIIGITVDGSGDNAGCSAETL